MSLPVAELELVLTQRQIATAGDLMESRLYLVDQFERKEEMELNVPVFVLKYIDENEAVLWICQVVLMRCILKRYVYYIINDFYFILI